VDYCVAEDELDAAVARLAAEVLANSRGSNRIAKALVAAAGERSYQDALHFERQMPFGMPEDLEQRMGAAKR